VFSEILAQSNDIKIEDVLDTSAVSGWDILIGVVVLIATWPVALLVGNITVWLVRRIPRIPEFVHGLARRGARVLVAVVGLAISMNLLGVNVGWFTVTVGVVLFLGVLMVRPLVQNLAAGLLLETRPSFEIGDEIETNGIRGEVIAIDARCTVIQTRDWERVHIPNTEVLSEAIIVFSAFDRRRASIELEVEYGADLEESSRLLIKAAQAVDGVHANPPPYVQARGFGAATYRLALYWWHDPHLASSSETLDGVVREVKRVLDEAGISLPSPELIVRQADERLG